MHSLLKGWPAIAVSISPNITGIGSSKEKENIMKYVVNIQVTLTFHSYVYHVFLIHTRCDIVSVRNSGTDRDCAGVVG